MLSVVGLFPYVVTYMQDITVFITLLSNFHVIYCRLFTILCNLHEINCNVYYYAV